MHLLKTTRLSPKIMVNQNLRSKSCSEFPLSCLWLTALSLHSQFYRNWSILFDTDHNQPCLFNPELRQGSEDTFFFRLAEFSLSFSRCAIQFKKDLTGPSCLPLPLLYVGYFCSHPLYHCLHPPSSVKTRQWILLPSVYFSMAKQPMGLIGGRMFYKSLPWPSWSKWKDHNLKGREHWLVKRRIMLQLFAWPGHTASYQWPSRNEGQDWQTLKQRLEWEALEMLSLLSCLLHMPAEL